MNTKIISGLIGFGLGTLVGALGLAAFAKNYVEKRRSDPEFSDTEETQDTIKCDQDKTDHAVQNPEELQTDKSFDERFERLIDVVKGRYPEDLPFTTSSDDESDGNKNEEDEEESLSDTLKYLSESDDSPDIPEV